MYISVCICVCEREYVCVNVGQKTTLGVLLLQMSSSLFFETESPTNLIFANAVRLCGQQAPRVILVSFSEALGLQACHHCACSLCGFWEWNRNTSGLHFTDWSISPALFHLFTLINLRVGWGLGVRWYGIWCGWVEVWSGERKDLGTAWDCL